MSYYNPHAPVGAPPPQGYPMDPYAKTGVEEGQHQHQPYPPPPGQPYPPSPPNQPYPPPPNQPYPPSPQQQQNREQYAPPPPGQPYPPPPAQPYPPPMAYPAHPYAQPYGYPPPQPFPPYAQPPPPPPHRHEGPSFAQGCLADVVAVVSWMHASKRKHGSQYKLSEDLVTIVGMSTLVRLDPRVLYSLLGIITCVDWTCSAKPVKFSLLGEYVVVLVIYLVTDKKKCFQLTNISIDINK